MTALSSAEFWARLLEIGFLNLLLSGDNAVVIALAVRALPRRQRLLGQIWGTAGAVVLRLLFVAIVTFLFSIPFLKLVGGLLLVWIAFKLVQPEAESGKGSRQGTSYWEAIWIILVADVTMSLDNVLAIAAAARGDMLLVGFGMASSLPLVMWGSGMLASLMNRYVWIIWLGGGVLGYVAGEMVLGDPIVSVRLGGVPHTLEVAVALLLGAVVAAAGWLRRSGRGKRHDEGRRHRAGHATRRKT
ncbi:MAG TPA: TerC family protein [Candidatus Methylomirabilis sp.]|nr:TerC family protein [Candidatus Methylomirabilis sp.]